MDDYLALARHVVDPNTHPDDSEQSEEEWLELKSNQKAHKKSKFENSGTGDNPELDFLDKLTEEDKSDPPFMEQVKNEVNQYMTSLKSARLKPKSARAINSLNSQQQKSKHVKFQIGKKSEFKSVKKAFVTKQIQKQPVGRPRKNLLFYKQGLRGSPPATPQIFID